MSRGSGFQLTGALGIRLPYAFKKLNAKVRTMFHATCTYVIQPEFFQASFSQLLKLRTNFEDLSSI